MKKSNFEKVGKLSLPVNDDRKYKFSYHKVSLIWSSIIQAKYEDGRNHGTGFRIDETNIPNTQHYYKTEQARYLAYNSYSNRWQ